MSIIWMKVALGKRERTCHVRWCTLRLWALRMKSSCSSSSWWTSTQSQRSTRENSWGLIIIKVLYQHHNWQVSEGARMICVNQDRLCTAWEKSLLGTHLQQTLGHMEQILKGGSCLVPFCIKVTALWLWEEGGNAEWSPIWHGDWSLSYWPM